MDYLKEAFGPWDWVLILVVTAMGTSMAYVHNARMKALILGLPLPFTFATLAVGMQVNSFNLSGLLLTWFFTIMVRQLHQKWKWNIFLSIILSVSFFCIAASIGTRFVPETELAFWGLIIFISISALLVVKFQKLEAEPGHKTPMPLYIKVPVIFMVVLGVILLKQELKGFVTMFPMVGVIAAYESRKSLSTMAAEIPKMILLFIPLVIIIHVSYDRLGLIGSMLAGWSVFLCILIPVTLKRIARIKSSQELA
ncbi:MAG: hypothetical protein HRT89_18060 [Lentisphaeria bacterium]|nr:hypothetical protein [Lentisphaeria bacterium]NQZ69962.1 hypothetical protein [Lentisphaeria bacterium]